MSLRIASLEEIGAENWDAFAAETPEAWLWHRSAICHGLSCWPGYLDISYGVLDERGRIVALMPLHCIESRGLMKSRQLHSLGGPALAQGIVGKARVALIEFIVESLDAALSRYDAMWAYARTATLTPAYVASPGWAISPLTLFGFEERSDSTWIVNLNRSEDDIRAGYSQLTRRELRKADETVSTIREAQGSKDLETYYALHTETYARTGASPHPFDYFRIIFEKLVPSGLARVLFFERGGKVVAAQNTGLWKAGAVYYSGASLNEKDAGENRALFDRQIMGARGAGCHFYETGQAYLMPANPKERGLSNFKASFGAVLARQPAGLRRGKELIPRLQAALADFRNAVRVPAAVQK